MDIVIKRRNYNGCLGIGSIFDYNVCLKLDRFDDKAFGSIKVNVDFLVSEVLRSKVLGSVCNELPFIMSEDDFLRVNKIVSLIKGDVKYKYDDNRFAEFGFDPNRLRYYDVTIDGDEFEILSSDENILELLNIFRFDKVSKCIDDNYKAMLE